MFRVKNIFVLLLTVLGLPEICLAQHSFMTNNISSSTTDPFELQDDKIMIVDNRYKVKKGSRNHRTENRSDQRNYGYDRDDRKQNNRRQVDRFIRQNSNGRIEVETNITDYGYDRHDRRQNNRRQVDRFIRRNSNGTIEVETFITN